MEKTNIFRGMEILMLVAALGLTACGGGGGGVGTGSTSPSSTTSGSGGSGGGGGGTTATSTYTLSWDAVAGTVTGYRVYYGTAPLTNQSPLGTIDTTVTSVDFSPGQYRIASGATLYMAVSTLGTNGIESPISQTVSVVIQ